jgi:hypothetical protein
MAPVSPVVVEREPCSIQISLPRRNPTMAATAGNAPKNITWIICLVLYIVALVAHFGIIHVDSQIAVWSWILGFGLLLVAVKVKGL